MVADSTIYAPASAVGRAGVSVFRVSGPQARQVFDRMARPATLPVPRQAVLRRLCHPVTLLPIDRALLLWFPAPHSFTGEDVVEIHAHGGKAVAGALTAGFAALDGYRLAEPGEFTRRAYHNGKMDLTEAEAIADLVHAETEAQRRQALRQMEGALGTLYEGWRSRLATALAYMEAAIDFADEDLPADTADRHVQTLNGLIEEIADHLNDHRRGERLRDGFSVAILGAPNAGKSSLLNALTRRDAAIVSSTAGTTRDIIEVHLDLGGYPVTLLDTAGLRDSADLIENEGMRRALQRAEAADVKLLVFDGTAWPQLDAATTALIDDNAMMVVNKADMMARGPELGIGETVISPRTPNPKSPPLFLSAKTGNGIPALLDKLVAFIDLRYADNGAPPPTRERHCAALDECAQHLNRALRAPEAALRAEDLRLAMRALGRITGRVDVEHLLDIIFRDFCIGK